MEPVTLVIFGITGNLSQIKLIPALYDMAEKGILPDIKIIGNARRRLTAEEFKAFIHTTLHSENIHHKHVIKPDVFKQILKKMDYLAGNLDDPNFYLNLKSHLNKIQAKNIIFYLATYPELYESVFQGLKKSGLNTHRGWVRLMVEKPIGSDLTSAKKLNRLLGKYFKEDQIFRLDHYLGRETLQNILTFRFGNGLFEPLINREFIDHIQITAAEDFGIGQRGGYFDKVGALRDVGQNHHLQMLAFATMDMPSSFTNEAVTLKRLELLKKLRPDRVIFGQYRGYLGEKNIGPQSQTDTFYALKAYIDNNRFRGVPIYIRSGKKMAQTVTEISIIFKTPTARLFKDLKHGLEPNVLIYRIQPNEGIVIKLLTKKPGHKIGLDKSYMQFCYRQDNIHTIPDPYERLLSDTIRGDQTFFNDAKEVEAQWSFIEGLTFEKPYLYETGSWGPKQADKMIKKDRREWLIPSMLFCSF